MRLRTLALLIPFLVVSFVPLSAVEIATEYFNGYGSSSTNINNLNGGTGWAAGWDSNTPANARIQYSPEIGLSWNASGYDNSGNLTGPNDGAAVYTTITTGSVIVPRNLSNTSQDVYWLSVLVSIDHVSDRTIFWLDSQTGASNSNDFIGLIDGNIQLRYDNLNFTTGDSPTVGTHLFLSKVEMNTNASNDAVSFWYDPDLSSGEAGLGAPDLFKDNADVFGIAFNGIAMQLTNLNSSLAGGETMDAIRIGTTFKDVTAVPEPSTYAFIFAAVVLFFAAKRRKV